MPIAAQPHFMFLHVVPSTAVAQLHAALCGLDLALIMTRTVVFGLGKARRLQHLQQRHHPPPPIPRSTLHGRRTGNSSFTAHLSTCVG